MEWPRRRISRDTSSKTLTCAFGTNSFFFVFFCHFWLQNSTPGVPPFSFFRPLERALAAFSSKLVSKGPQVVPVDVCYLLSSLLLLLCLFLFQTHCCMIFLSVTLGHLLMSCGMAGAAVGYTAASQPTKRVTSVEIWKYLAGSCICGKYISEV